jgi:hypothetical protein
VGDQLVAEGAIWWSEDGLAWTSAIDAGTLVMIGSVSAGFVAVGDPPAGGATVLLTSPDGQSWTGHEGKLPAGDAWGLGFDGHRAAFVDSSDSANLIWVSSQSGAEWSSYAMPGRTGNLSDAAVAIMGNRVIVHARSETSVWVGDIP